MHNSSLNPHNSSTVNAQTEQPHILKAESTELQVHIQINNKLISEMTFSGALSEDPILQIYKKHCIGYGLRECAEHSAIYVISEVTKDSPIKTENGIIGLHQVSPALKIAQDNLRQLNRTIQNTEDGWNFDDRGLSPQWTAQSYEQQSAQIVTVQKELLDTLGIKPDSLHLDTIDQYGRLFFQFTEQIDASTKASLLLKLEHALQDNLGERIEVFLTEMKDQNKIRRLYEQRRA